jgi:DnaK suppressor protein
MPGPRPGCHDGGMNTVTDETLRISRARLMARGAELRDRIRRVQRDLRRTDHPLPADAPDAAIEMENDEILQALDETARRELHEIEHALERFEAGTFALCEACGAEIEEARLIAVPYTTHCRRCAKDG